MLPTLHVFVATAGCDAELARVSVSVVALALVPSAVEREKDNRVGAFVHRNQIALPAAEQLALEDHRVVHRDPGLVTVLAGIVANAHLYLRRALTGHGEVDVVDWVDVEVIPQGQSAQHRGKLAFHQTRRREVAYVPVGLLQQAHHLDGLVRDYIEAPFALAIAESARALRHLRAHLQFGCGKR